MNDEVCVEKHKRIDEQLNTHNTRLNNHSERIDKIEQNQSRVDIKIENLCEQIKALVSLMKWFLGTFAGALIGFFFYAIQNNLFK